jgi:uncharacterized heparinase superfamily protein
VSGLTNGISNSVFRSRLYKLALMGRGPTRLFSLPPDCEARGVPMGDPARGAAIVQGRFDLCGTAHQLGESPWSVDWLTEDEGIALHRFDWLGDLAALGTEEARKTAESLLERWDERFGTFTPVSWRSDVLATRIINCLTHFEVLFDPAEPPFHIRFLDCLARQVRHLRRVVQTEPDEPDRLFALKGLIYGECCVISEPERIARALALLEREIESQILPDGSHVSRSPGHQLTVLETLIDIRDTLTAASNEVPVALRHAIDRMAPMTRFCRLGDGALPCFHGGGRPTPAHVDHVLERSDAHGKAPKRAHYASYERVEAGDLILLLDGGGPPEAPHDRDGHAGMMSFELSAGAHRLFVNCGIGPGAPGHWREALRTTAAHSTVTVADTNACELLPDGIGRRPGEVDCDRGERDGSIWISASHNGYEPRFGLTHRRRFYVNENDADLRGEDILVADADTEETPFEVRFHLHPKVVVSQDETATRMTFSLPDGSQWRMRTERPAALEKSIYWDDDEGAMPSLQLVIRAAAAGEATAIKWRLRPLTEEN